jgi:hypothetical protein
MIPCELCSTPTSMTGTKRCDRCWELEGRIMRDPELAAKILGSQCGPNGEALELAEEWKERADDCGRLARAVLLRGATGCENHTNFRSSEPFCPVCLTEDVNALRQFYEGVKESFGDTCECHICGTSDPWWTDSNADYATREARAKLEPSPCATGDRSDA